MPLNETIIRINTENTKLYENYVKQYDVEAHYVLFVYIDESGVYLCAAGKVDNYRIFPETNVFHTSHLSAE